MSACRSSSADGSADPMPAVAPGGAGSTELPLQAPAAPSAASPLARIVVFTSGLSNYSVCKGLAELARELPQTEWLVFEHRPARAMGRVLRNQWRNLKRNGPRWIAHQMADVSARIAAHTRREPLRLRPTPGMQ